MPRGSQQVVAEIQLPQMVRAVVEEELENLNILLNDDRVDMDRFVAEMNRIGAEFHEAISLN